MQRGQSALFPRSTACLSRRHVCTTLSSRRADSTLHRHLGRREIHHNAAPWNTTCRGYATIHLLTLRGLLQVRHNACQREACTGVSLSLIEHGDVGLWIKHQVRHHCHRRLIEPVAQIETIGNRTSFWNSRSTGFLGSSCCDLVLRHQNLLSGCIQTPTENPLFDFHIRNARIILSGDSRIPSSINRTEVSYRC